MTYGRVRATTCSHTFYHTCYHTENHDEQRHTDNLLEHESKSHVEFLWKIKAKCLFISNRTFVYLKYKFRFKINKESMCTNI